MDGNDGLREAGVLLVGPKMELADGNNRVAGLAQPMMPARDRAVVRVGVVPESDLVNVFAGGERGARRNADRRRRPARRETGAAGSKPVEMRGLHDRVAVAAHRTAAVLV